ncbi:MAG: transposase [Vicinamibacterales bacterium]
MPRKRYTPNEAIQHLRWVEPDPGKGLAGLDACRKLGITERTYYGWKKEYGGVHSQRMHTS